MTALQIAVVRMVALVVAGPAKAWRQQRRRRAARPDALVAALASRPGSVASAPDVAADVLLLVVQQRASSALRRSVDQLATTLTCPSCCRTVSAASDAFLQIHDDGLAWRHAGNELRAAGPNGPTHVLLRLLGADADLCEAVEQLEAGALRPGASCPPTARALVLRATTAGQEGGWNTVEHELVDETTVAGLAAAPEGPRSPWAATFPRELQEVLAAHDGSQSQWRREMSGLAPWPEEDAEGNRASVAELDGSYARQVADVGRHAERTLLTAARRELDATTAACRARAAALDEPDDLDRVAAAAVVAEASYLDAILQFLVSHRTRRAGRAQAQVDELAARLRRCQEWIRSLPDRPDPLEVLLGLAGPLSPPLVDGWDASTECRRHRAATAAALRHSLGASQDAAARLVADVGQELDRRNRSAEARFRGILTGAAGAVDSLWAEHLGRLAHAYLGPVARWTRDTSGILEAGTADIDPAGTGVPAAVAPSGAHARRTIDRSSTEGCGAAGVLGVELAVG